MNDPRGNGVDRRTGGCWGGQQDDGHGLREVLAQVGWRTGGASAGAGEGGSRPHPLLPSPSSHFLGAPRAYPYPFHTELVSLIEEAVG